MERRKGRREECSGWNKREDRGKGEVEMRGGERRGGERRGEGRRGEEE